MAELWKKILIIFALFFFLSLTATLAWNFFARKSTGETVVFSCIDPQGDDFGPGYIIYPLDEAFYPYKGLFDLLKFEVVRDEFNYRFCFQFNQLTNPWEAPLGFSHPVLELFIDNFPGGMEQHLIRDIPLSFPPDRKWDRLLRISGWGINLYAADKRGKKVTSVEFSRERIKIDKNTIIVSIPREVTGPVEGAGLWLFVGSRDAGSRGGLRKVLEEPTFWHFGGRQGKWDLPYLDLLHPDQGAHRMLAGIDRRPVITPLETGSKGEFWKIIIPGLLLVIFLYLFLLKKSILPWQGANNKG